MLADNHKILENEIFLKKDPVFFKKSVDKTGYCLVY